MADERAGRIAGVGYDYAGQPKERIDSCNLCGGGCFVTIVHRDRYGFPVRASGCRRCGLVFLNPRMTAAVYAEFYDGVYRPLVSAYHGRRIDAETIQEEQRDYARERAETLADFLPARADGDRVLLDIGGSTGVVAAHLAERFGLRATVLDPAPAEIEAARGLGLETVTGFVEDYDPGDRRFDVVTLCQTVDHLLDIRGTLKRIRGLLDEDGLFFVDIVDFRAAYLRKESVEEAIKVDHPYYLTEGTMVAYLRRSGFEILGLDYAADHLHVSYVCRPGEAAAEACPTDSEVGRLWREIRTVQNRPRVRA